MPRSPLYADPYTPSSPSARSVAGSSFLEEVPCAFAAGYSPDSAHRLLAPEIMPRAISFPAVCPSLSGMWKREACIAGWGRAQHSSLFFQARTESEGNRFPLSYHWMPASQQSQEEPETAKQRLRCDPVYRNWR